MSGIDDEKQPEVFLREEWITADTVNRYTCYQREDGQIVKHGRCQTLLKSGQVLEEGVVRHGWREGVWVAYHENGRLESTGEYRSGEPVGLLKRWYETGVLRSEWMMEEGYSHGLHRDYHPNGVLKEEAMYKDDFKNGRCQVWDENGVLLADGIYEWDQPLDGTFIIDEEIQPDPKYPTFGEYIDAFLNRRRAVVEVRNGEAIAGKLLQPPQ
jgi:hypothetical protein